jgi:hypothetical protein
LLVELSRVAHDAWLRGERFSSTVMEGGRLQEMRQSLLTDTALGLASILAPGWGADDATLDFAPVRDDYDQRLTFGMVEAFVATIATQFSVPTDVTRQTLEAVGDGGAALLLVRSCEPDEQPFPVVAVGFEDHTLREFVEFVRLACEISRPVTLPGLAVDTSITTVLHGGTRWRGVAGGTGLALLRATPDRLEQATAWAYVFASSSQTRSEVR